MDTFQSIVNGFIVALVPTNLLYTFLGVFMGTVIGVLPGIGPGAGIALLIPLTFNMNPTSALIMMAGIYYGAMYGGSTTSILINVPGEAASVMTCLDGYQMARKGRAGAALAIAAIASFIAGTVGVIGLSLLSLPLTAMALKFGPPEYFTLMIFALTAVTMLTGKSAAKAMLSTLLGLMIATVGIDLQSGQPRYTLGIPEFMEGIGFLVVVVGLFAVGEVLSSIEELYKGKLELIRIKGKIWLTREEWRRSIHPIFRGGIIGFLVGVLPGAGAVIATILSYATEKKFSKTPEKFGTGMIEGVAGPEAANNACTAGAIVPMLTLGVPGSGAAALMMGALIMHGIQPGPLLFQRHPDLVWGFVDSMYLGNLMLLVMNLPLVAIFVRLLYIPTGIFLPLVLGISAIGIYSLDASVLDLYLTLFFGVLGYIFRKVDIPTAPLILALVLAGMMEQSFRRAMTISDGNPMIFVHSVISVSFLTLAVAVVVLPILLRRLKKWKKAIEEDLEM